MSQRRKHDRVNVNLPISCNFLNSSLSQKKLITMGNVYNLSMGGMKIGLPCSEESMYSEAMRYFVHFPAPFNKFNGDGKVKWSYRDPNKNLLIFGMEFSNLNEDQRKELEHIIDELDDDNSIKE
jgi:c-di-GMP-binding flagellar brake protein YcgR